MPDKRKPTTSSNDIQNKKRKIHYKTTRPLGLPLNIWQNIFHNLSQHELGDLASCNKNFNQLIHHTYLNKNNISFFKKAPPPERNYLKQPISTLLLEKHKRGEKITALINIDQDYYACASHDQMISIWERKTNTCTESFILTHQAINKLALYTAKNTATKHLICGHLNGQIDIIDLNAKQTTTFQLHISNIVGLHITHNHQLLSAGFEGAIHKISLLSNQIEYNVLPFYKQINCTAILDNHCLAVHYVDNTIKIWDLSSKQCLNELKHDNLFEFSINCMLPLANNQLVYGGGDNHLILWDAEKSKVCAQKKLNNEDGPNLISITGITTLPTHDIAVCRDNGCITIHDPTTLDIKNTVKLPHNLQSIHSTYDGNIICGTQSGKIVVCTFDWLIKHKAPSFCPIF